MSNKFLIFLLGLFLSIIPDIFLLNEYFNESQKCVLRVLILMIFLWITEVIPTPITALNSNFSYSSYTRCRVKKSFE